MTLPGGNTGLRLPAPRQAHSPSGYTDIHGYGSNFAVISPRHICARPGLSCWNGVMQRFFWSNRALSKPQFCTSIGSC